MILTILDSMGHRKREIEIITIVIILTVLCMACGTEGEDATEEEFDQIMKCLDERVPEIFDEWNDYVVEKSEGKAHMMEMMAGGYELEDVYRDYAKTEYLGKYYCVYVGESWDDHCVNWEYFYVSEDFDEVLWHDFIPLMDSDYCVFYLDEWRNSEWYPKLGE